MCKPLVTSSCSCVDHRNVVHLQSDPGIEQTVCQLLSPPATLSLSQHGAIHPVWYLLFSDTCCFLTPPVAAAGATHLM